MRAAEPTGLGAVVEAGASGNPMRVRMVGVVRDGEISWWSRFYGFCGWRALNDPVVLSPGYTDGAA